MRAVLIAALLTITGAAQAAEYWQSDNLLACLVGKGTVAMRHGATADAAYNEANTSCIGTADPPPPKNVDGVDFSNYAHALAWQILHRAEGAI